MTSYRALISIPIEASSDGAAIAAANEQAASLRHDDGITIAGHVELVGEVRDDLLEITRVVRADPQFVRQLGPDWKP